MSNGLGSGLSSFQTDKRYTRHLLRCSRQQMHLRNGNGNGIGTLIFRARGKSFSHVFLTYARHFCRRRKDTDTEKWQFARSRKKKDGEFQNHAVDGHAGGLSFSFRETWDLHQCVNMEHIINYAHGPAFAVEPTYLTFFGIEKFFVPWPLFLWISYQQK